eukprot:363563-Chlamydomonas_euryale.AAC.9
MANGVCRAVQRHACGVATNVEWHVHGELSGMQASRAATAQHSNVKRVRGMAWHAATHFLVTAQS